MDRCKFRFTYTRPFNRTLAPQLKVFSYSFRSSRTLLRGHITKAVVGLYLGGPQRLGKRVIFGLPFGIKLGFCFGHNPDSSFLKLKRLRCPLRLTTHPRLNTCFSSGVCVLSLCLKLPKHLICPLVKISVFLQGGTALAGDCERDKDSFHT